MTKNQRRELGNNSLLRTDFTARDGVYGIQVYRVETPCRVIPGRMKTYIVLAQNVCVLKNLCFHYIYESNDVVITLDW